MGRRGRRRQSHTGGNRRSKSGGDRCCTHSDIRGLILSREHERRQEIGDANDVVTKGPEVSDRSRGDLEVGEEPHAIAEVFSLASHAPYRAA